MNTDPIRDALETVEWIAAGHCPVCRQFVRRFADGRVASGVHTDDCVIGQAIESLRAEGRWRRWEYK